MAKKVNSVIAVPLLDPSPSGTASTVQTLGNIIVSVVGTGVLGLPFAFRTAGWLAGSIGVIVAAISIYYCMILLVECRDSFQEDESRTDVRTYGDLGHKAFGRMGRYVTEFLIVISQCGGSVAYLVFIGQNLASIFSTYQITFSSFVLILIPIEIALSWIRSLSALAPFSVFADICNVLAMAVVLKEDLGMFDSLSNRKAIRSVGGLPFTLGVSVFCFEGVGMTLPLEASMREKGRFQWVLMLAFTGITLVYVCFGFFGYLAYGDNTADIITLNLPDNDWSATAVKVGLCVGLTFTFPIMMHPIHEILESKLRESGWLRKLCYSRGAADRMWERYVVYVSRALLVVVLAVVALFVPGFGVFVSLVGGTVCSLLAFVFPIMFHFIFMGSTLGFWKRSLDFVILVCGLAFAAYSTYNAAVGKG